MADWTYTKLLASVAGTLNKTNLTAVIPDLVSLGESVLLRRVKGRDRVQTIDAEVSDGAISLPCGFVDIVALSLTDPIKRLDYVTPEAFDALDLTDGEPRFYTIVKSEVLFSPPPAETTTVRLRYLARICRLSSTVAYNWLLREHPDAYLYAALAESAPYIRDDERLPMWVSRLNNIIAEINDNQPRQRTKLRMDELSAHRGRFDIIRG